VVCALEGLNLLFKLIEVVAETASFDEFVTKGGTIGD
jgi:hypothetical protein